MADRLRSATSPYLLQHADNPVDWWQWGDEAFAEARRRDVPVLLSVGYAACHWCHVMARESFEDDGVAEVVNASFVAIKVDREERPDVDAVYMSATTAMTGQGGWPMTAFLTPDGEAFHCGTYFPRDQFLDVLGAVRDAWADARDAVVQRGSAVTAAIGQATAPLPAAPLDDVVLAETVATLRREADVVRGGFGGAPKFPPSMTLEHLLRHHARTGDANALAMVSRTCEAMARGGIYDQLGGGFARYSVDAAWVVPHFEKMLYDNAQLLRVYAHWWRATGSPLAARVVRETAEFLLRDLRTAEGGFASALDADTPVDGSAHGGARDHDSARQGGAGHGVEGLTYVWTPAQLREVLGDDDGTGAAAVLGVTAEGTFQDGASTLQLPRDPDPAWWARVRPALFAARAARPQPARDDKVVTAWNGLAVAALADAGALFGRDDWVDAARECADLVLRLHVVDGRLRRASRDGVVGSAPGVAADHGDLAEGLLALHQATGEARWLAVAGDLLDVALERFAVRTGEASRADGVGDGGTAGGADGGVGADGGAAGVADGGTAGFAVDGGFYDAADDAERLVVRPRDPSDGPEPSGQSALSGALATSAALTGSSRHRAAAEAAVRASGTLARRAPRFAGWVLAAAEGLAAGPLQVAVVGTGPGAGELAATARRATSPGAVVVHGEPDAPGVPLLADRPLVDGGPAAYVCRGFVCDRPVTTPDDLAAALSHTFPAR